MEMRLYYVAYRHFLPDGLEMLEGPFGTTWEADKALDRMVAGAVGSDENLVIVRETKEVEIV